MIIHGDCLRELKAMSDSSVDSIVTDPPYGLSFMGKKWDYEVPSIEIWRECLRVLKPGGHLLSFAGTRTYHRMACNIEDAGFEIRDQIMWLYGSGFPKSHDISKAIDKAAGEYVPGEVLPSSRKSDASQTGIATTFREKTASNPQTESAKQWQGWGTALKPANEPIVVARKPLEAGLTVAANVLKYGTGALNIDASRIETNGDTSNQRKSKNGHGGVVTNFSSGKPGEGFDYNPQGRWPANVLLDEESSASLDLQVGDNVSRFFYCAKASKSERGEGNVHPTVKPVKLMEYLIRLVTPPNGKVLDPFAGSGTTLIAAVKNNFEFIGIERESEYVQIIRARVKQAQLEKGA